MEEILDIVDVQDNILGNAIYDEVHAKNLRHRIVHVLIQNDKGELLLQKRAKHKSSYPLYWSMSVGGHVRHKETYEQAALREAEEEVGFVPKELQKVYHGSFTNEIGHTINFVTFKIIYNGPFTINEEEVEEVKFFTKDELKQALQSNEKIQPELAYVLEQILI